LIFYLKRLKKKMIDSHCHLDHEPLHENLSDVISRSKDCGITKLLTICTTPDSFENIKAIVEKDQMIYGTFGIHPHETGSNQVDKQTIIKCVNENVKIIGIGDITLQTEYIIKKIEFTLEEAGFSLADVVRTRIFIKDISKWEEVAQVHSYLFGTVMPASTLVEVSNLIHPDLLLEIEAQAVKENT
jgi:Tat protein secretion system quality control protein TatD with DNase activity